MTLLVHKLTGRRQALLFFARFTPGNYIEYYNVVGHGRLEGVHSALSLNLVQVAHLRVWPVAHDQVDLVCSLGLVLTDPTVLIRVVIWLFAGKIDVFGVLSKRLAGKFLLGF